MNGRIGLVVLVKERGRERNGPVIFRGWVE
jgi:hypothetical protein